MISVGNNKAVLCKGDFHPAALYKGDKKIAGYSVEEFSGEGSVVLENCYNDKLHNAQIIGNSIQDGTPTPEAPIEVQSVGKLVTEGEYAGKYKILVRARGKNLFNPNLRKNVWSNGLNLKYLPDEDCFVINGTVTEGHTGGIDLGRNHANLGIKVKSGKYYKNSVVFLGGSTSKVVNLYSFFGTNSTGEGISPTNWEDVDFSSNVAEGYTKSVTSLPNGAYISSYWVYLYNVSGVTFNNFKFRVMLTETDATSGSTSNAPIDYEPYIEPQTFNIYLDEPLRKIGDYADYMDFGKSMVVRSVKKLLLSGSEDWKESGYNNQIKIDYIQFWTDYCRNITGGYVALSNKFKCVGQKEWSDLKLEQEFFAVTSTPDFGIRLSTSKVTSLNEFTKWLSENNVALLFSLATPTEDLIDLPELPTFKGTTIIEVDTEIPAKISGKYKRTEE